MLPSQLVITLLLDLRDKRKGGYHVEDPKEPMNEFVYELQGLGNHAILTNFLTPIEKEFNKEGTM